MKYLKIFTLSIFLMLSCQLYAVIVANTVQVNVSVEDAEMQHATITNVKFNGEDVDISKKSFMNRKISKSFKVSPGQYEIEWSTEKSEKPWGGKKEVKKYNKTIVIEMSDAVVYLNIRGDTLTTY